MIDLPTPRPPHDGPVARLLVWSGSDEQDWQRAADALLRRLTGDARPDLDDTAGRRAPNPCGPVRGAVVAATREEAVAGVRAARPGAGRRRSVALLFPGQGAQQDGMGVGLYRWEPSFADDVDEVLRLFGAHGRDIAEDWRSPRPVVELDDVRRAQPLLFALDWALGRLVCRWGVRPAALLGHSVGEVAAAALAGVFGVADAVATMRDRIDRLTGLAAGGMLAVAATPDDVRPFLDEAGGAVVMGAMNAPRQLMLAGLDGPLGEVERALRGAGHGCRRARATTAFHSPAIADALAGSRDTLADLSLHPPAIPLYSGYTGGLLAADTATDVAFWADQPAQPVLFGPALDQLLADGDRLLVEAGPAQSLSAIARRHPKVRAGGSDVVSLLPALPGDAGQDRRAVLSVAAALWLEGHDLDPVVLTS